MDFRATPIVRLPDAASIVFLQGLVYAGPAHQQHTLDMVNAAANHQPGAKAWMINYSTERPPCKEDLKNGTERIWSFAHLAVGSDRRLRFTGRKFRLEELPRQTEEEEEKDEKIAKRIKLGEHTLDILKVEETSAEERQRLLAQLGQAQQNLALNHANFGGVPVEQRPVLKRKEREEEQTTDLGGDQDEKLVVSAESVKPAEQVAAESVPAGEK